MSNLAINNCIYPSQWSCDCDSISGAPEKLLFKLGTLHPNQPQNDFQNYRQLNPQLFVKNYSKEFYPICGWGPCPEKTLYMASDPTLMDVPRGEVMPLDAPPQDTLIRLDQIYTDPNLQNYGATYQSYCSINAGQIQYYVDNDLASPFPAPNFVTTAKTAGLLYKDPMGGIKPEYERETIYCKEDGCNKKDCNQYKFGLSWLDDSTFHREDIMSRQMSKNNQQRWETRWS